jgi:hypothetical protein
MARDEHEYVRRRALESLAKVGSPAVEELALDAWHRPDEDQEHARMMVLHCLDHIGSLLLEPLLAEAERDGRQYLREFAQGLRPRRSPEKGKQAEPIYGPRCQERAPRNSTGSPTDFPTDLPKP